MKKTMRFLVYLYLSSGPANPARAALDRLELQILRFSALYGHLDALLDNYNNTFRKCPLVHVCNMEYTIDANGVETFGYKILESAVPPGYDMLTNIRKFVSGHREAEQQLIIVEPMSIHDPIPWWAAPDPEEKFDIDTLHCVDDAESVDRLIEGI